MSYEVRPTGAHAFRCDIQSCPAELLAPDEPELTQDAHALGWTRLSVGDVCPSCMRGVHMGAGQMRARLGTMGVVGDEVQVQAPGPVSAGDPMLQEIDGVPTEVATYLEHGGQGDMVRAKLKFPEVQARVAMSPQLAAVVGTQASQSEHAGFAPPGSYERGHAGGDYPVQDSGDDLFDGFGELPEPEPQRHVDAPYDPSKLDPEPRHLVKPEMATLKAQGGTDGGAGIVQAQPPLDPQRVRKAKAGAPPRKPAIDPDALVAANNLFGFLDKTGYTPDDK